MRFKIDENLPVIAKQILTDKGHDAINILEQKMGGESDNRISEVIQDEKRTLITLDLDFANIKTYPPQDYHGLIVFRLQCQDKESVLSAMRTVLRFLDEEPLTGYLWIIDENKLRVRGGD